jgi:hypothetical protein
MVGQHRRGESRMKRWGDLRLCQLGQFFHSGLDIEIEPWVGGAPGFQRLTTIA